MNLNVLQNSGFVYGAYGSGIRVVLGSCLGEPVLYRIRELFLLAFFLFVF